MYISNELIYIQMQKTGCSHIASILAELFEGEIVGKHNAASENQISLNRYFISSIRNPWDWYLSLWTFGVQGGGRLRYSLTQKNIWREVKLMLRNSWNGYKALMIEFSKDVNWWIDVYERDDDVEAFRRWLKRIHEPKMSQFLGEGYSNTCITDTCGFMTYRYLYLCCRNVQKLQKSKFISDYTQLEKYEKSNCYIDYFIRQESLEENLIEAIEKIRPLTEQEKGFIYSKKKTNTSRRSLSISDYYDDCSIELVANRERLLIEKFNYSPPALSNM